jgi:hypothetical protein
MVVKTLKYGIITTGALALGGGLLFGRDLVSYVSSSARSVQSAVKDSVPIEFELRRARDLMDDIIPEMHCNVRLIAQQEVEIDALRKDVGMSRESVKAETVQILKLKDALGKGEQKFPLRRHRVHARSGEGRPGRRLDNVKEADLILSGKQRLLENRTKALAAAMQALERTRAQKSLLESQIAALEGQHKLLQATSVGSSIQVDNSKLAQTQKLIAQIKKQLDTAERVLAHEAKFTQPIQVDAVSEKDVVAQAEEYLATARK